MIELQRSTALCPEKSLILAILQHAIEELSVSVLYMRRDAADWIMLDNDFIFGFVPICEVLEISPSALRKQLATLIERGLGEKKKRDERGRPLAEPMPHDPSASHEYVASMHCRECRDRYHRWYKQHGPVKAQRA